MCVSHIVILALTCAVVVNGTTAEAQEPRAGTRKARHVDVQTLSAPLGLRVSTAAADGDALEIALRHLRAQRAALGLTEADLADPLVSSQHVSEHTGVAHIYLRQRHNGIEVHLAEINVNVTRDGQVLSLGSSFVPDLAGAVRNQAPMADAAQSAMTAVTALGMTALSPIVVVDTLGGPAQEVTLSDGGISRAPIPARLVYERLESGDVVLSWLLEIEERDSHHWWSISVDAETGDLLEQNDYTVQDFWGQPPIAPATTEGSDEAARHAAPLPSPPIAGVPGSGSYRVYDWPHGDPNDGDRAIVVDPADPASSPFGWHDTDGIPGVESTQTVGNNVDAYLDRGNDNTAAAAERADGAAALTFDFPVDLSQSPTSYQPAAVTNLFYWNNLMHDISYRYGFTESAGNFQVNNYGKFEAPTGTPSGAGDQVRAEAQDGGGMNNANFGTNVDGIRPRMQMFLWLPPGGYQVQVTSGPVGNYAAARANFGAFLSDIFVTQPTADVVLATPNNACAPLVGFPAGSIAYADAGGCNSVTKAQNAQNAGAVGIIVDTGQAVPGAITGVSLTVNIPVLGLSTANAAILRPALPWFAKMAFLGTPAPLRDGDFDAVVVAHEYTHGISNRLTGGRLTVSCLNNDEQMGEGWSDWIALAFTHDPNRSVQRTRGLGPYIRFTGVDGPGIRPTPYSTDMTIDPTTYDDIRTLAIPHGVGYAWATMLWEVSWNLIDKHGFNPNVYESWDTGGNNLAIQLVMDGMKLQSCRPGFVNGRDAILQADQVLTGGANQCAIWKGFAKRGLGFSASQGLSSDDVTDGVEAFDQPPLCQAALSVDPPSLTSTQTRNKTKFQSFHIRNTAAEDGAELTWTITETATDCSAPADLPWVSAWPPHGTTAAADSSRVWVRFDSDRLRIGTYTGKLCISSNAATTPTEVPLSLKVIYKFEGFFGTVDNPPVVNSEHAGRTVPVIFDLDASRWTSIFAPGSPASRPISCATREPIGPFEPASGKLTMDDDDHGRDGHGRDDREGHDNDWRDRDDGHDKKFVYLWKTKSAWRNTCRELVVGLNDGTEHNAFFRFR